MPAAQLWGSSHPKLMVFQSVVPVWADLLPGPSWPPTPRPLRHSLDWSVAGDGGIVSAPGSSLEVPRKTRSDQLLSFK